MEFFIRQSALFSLSSASFRICRDCSAQDGFFTLLEVELQGWRECWWSCCAEGRVKGTDLREVPKNEESVGVGKVMPTGHTIAPAWFMWKSVLGIAMPGEKTLTALSHTQLLPNSPHCWPRKLQLSPGFRGLNLNLNYREEWCTHWHGLVEVTINPLLSFIF